MIGLQELRALQLGFYRINFDAFAGIARSTLSAGPDYAIIEWPLFAQNPIAYTTRASGDFGEKLLQLARKRAKEGERHG